MRVALLQYPIVWANKAENIRLVRQRVMNIAHQADVALLPEMFSTGFCTDRPDLAESVDGETMHALQSLADESQMALVGSFICSEQGKLYNRGFFLRPQDTPVFVDKAHLYKHGGEDRFFIPGRQRTIITYMGVRFRLLLCYDLRFPIWARQKKDQLYDVLLVSANWPEMRIAFWDALVAARATENQCYICAVNPVGDDGLGLHYNGHSVAYDTRLQPIGHFNDNESGTQIVNLDIEQLHHFRQVSPLWQDADDYHIQ